MTVGKQSSGGGDSDKKRPRRPAPWWTTRTVRLPALLVCLGLTVFALVASGGSSSPDGADGSSPRHTCSPAASTPLQRVGWPQLHALRASVLAVMAPLARSRYAFGSVSPEDAWSDELPQALSSPSAGGSWPASYEMRSWVTDPQLAPQHDDIVADVFQFADREHARQFFAGASVARCHRKGTSPHASQPPQARDLVWINPDGVTQEDVFLLRGRRVYRVSNVRPPAHPSSHQQQTGARRVDALACGLPDAQCSRPHT